MKIQPANRIDRLPTYILGRLKQLIYERRKAGFDVIDMNMGNPSDAPPDPVVEKIREAVLDPRNSRYSASAGVYNLRRDMAIKYERKWGVELDPNTEVIATIGSKEGFSHMCLALMGPGDIAVVPDPAFQIHTTAVVLAGGSVYLVPMGNDDAFLARIDDVLHHLQPKPKCIILCYPNNPTTMTVDQGFFEKVVELAHRHQVMVMHDFAYGETMFDGYKAPSYLQALGAKEFGVEFTTLSKPYNMAGWRIGFCCGNPEMVKRSVQRSKATTTTASSRRCRSPPSSPCARAINTSKRRTASTRSAATCSCPACASSAGKSRAPAPPCSSGPRSSPNTSRRTTTPPTISAWPWSTRRKSP